MRWGWDDPDTASYYERFCRTHDRYRAANATLAKHAGLDAGQRVLDVAAGTGRTAEAVLPWIGEAGRIVCYEPAEAMRSAGRERLPDARLEWTDALPEPPLRFDRVLCGAAIWMMFPIEETLRSLAALVASGGALCFNIPSLCLLIGDEPGGGEDPLLLELPARLVNGERPEMEEWKGVLPDVDGIESTLADCGLRVERWTERRRLTQCAYRDWLKIPVIGISPGADAEERARAVDEAFLRVDRDSWKWEGWTGWTAWAEGA